MKPIFSTLIRQETCLVRNTFRRLAVIKQSLYASTAHKISGKLLRVRSKLTPFLRRSCQRVTRSRLPQSNNSTCTSSFACSRRNTSRSSRVNSAQTSRRSTHASCKPWPRPAARRGFRLPCKRPTRPPQKPVNHPSPKRAWSSTCRPIKKACG